MSQLQLSLFGEPIIRHNGQTLTFSTRKALALLAYLTIEGGMHTRKSLSEAFWPELDAEHGRAALRATLLELRNLFERPHAPGEQAHLLIKHDMLAFDQKSSFMVDLFLVERVYTQTIAGSTDKASGSMRAEIEQATQVIRGPFLSGFTLRDSQFFDDWMCQQREYWNLRVQKLFAIQSHLYERTGAREQAIDTVSRWLRFDPLAEEGYRRLMRLRFAQGDRISALRVYSTCRDVLAEALQIEPEPETIALAKRLRRTTPVRAKRSQTTYASTQPASTHILDGPLFVRDTEFGVLIDRYQYVSAGQPNLVLLQGESGIGKTRLAGEFVSWVQAQGASLLTGQTLRMGRQLPYQPFIDILRQHLQQERAPDELIDEVWLSELSRLLPELRERFPNLPVPTVDEELGHYHLLETIIRLIRKLATRHPLLLFLDDVQWADTQTLDALLYIAHSLAEQPAPVLLLLNVRLENGRLLDRQSTWLQALKRTRIAVTTRNLAVFSKAETQRFVQSLPWVAHPDNALSNNTNEMYAADSSASAPYQEDRISFANWLYKQTHGQPFYLVEVLKRLIERELVSPSLQKNDRWALVLNYEQIKQAKRNELIPSSVWELIVARLRHLTPAAWNLLVAAALLGTELTFEQLCQVAQVENGTGIDALEELIRVGLVYEENVAGEDQSYSHYCFPGEMVREVVSQEAGTTRQRLLRRRVSSLMEGRAKERQQSIPRMVHFTDDTECPLPEIDNEEREHLLSTTLLHAE